MAANDNTEKVIMLFEAQNKDVLRKMDQIERKQRQTFAKGAKNVKSFNMQMQKTAATAKAVAASLSGFGGVGIAFGLTGLASSLANVTAEMSRFAKQADLVGASTEELQRLEYGFGLAGVASADLNKALEQFNKRLSEAEMKGGYLADILKANNIALRDQSGKMRPVVDLLKDYADLVSNAGSSQEKLSLANEAFGRSGNDMVLALRNGADGVRDLMSEADKAGGVIEEELLRKAEKVDDQFAQLSRTIGVNLKTAVLEVGSALSDWGVSETLMQDIASAKAFLKSPSIAKFEAMMGQPAIFDDPESVGRVALMRKLQAGQTSDFSGFNDLLAKVNTPKSGGVTSDNKPTLIPTRPDPERTKAASSAKKQADQVQKVIEALQHENELIGMNAQRQRVMNEIRKAGAGATEAQKEKIEELVVANDNATQRMESLNFVSEQAQSALMGMFSGITSQIKTGNDALDSFLQTLIQTSLQAALFGNGPMAGLFGTVGKGLFGGFFANGGNLGAGKWGIAGEAGPEIIKGPASVVPMSKMGGGGGVTISTVIDATGADQAAIARLQAGLEQRDRNLRRDVLAITGRQQARGY